LKDKNGNGFGVVFGDSSDNVLAAATDCLPTLYQPAIVAEVLCFGWALHMLRLKWTSKV